MRVAFLFHFLKINILSGLFAGRRRLVLTICRVIGLVHLFLLHTVVHFPEPFFDLTGGNKNRDDQFKNELVRYNDQDGI
jgi:hypothetical protein